MTDETAGPATAGAEDSYLVAADIGGTFTDVLLLRDDGGLTPMKVLSTPPNFGKGVISGVLDSLSEASADPNNVTAVLHATTVATNAILERRGGKTALITTKGFRDVLELGRLRRPLLYDLSWRKPTPLVRRRDRHELAQRIDHEGRVLTPIDLAELGQLAKRMQEDCIEAVAVCLINSHVLPDEERLVAGELRRLLPDVYVSASVDISPEQGEFERTSTVVVNSYVGSVVRKYVNDLESDLITEGINAPFSIMQSSGGLLDAASVVESPVQIIESGPAAGVIAVQKLARIMGLDNVIAFDMGGTTAKASLIENGTPFVASDYEVGAGMNITRSMGKGAGYTIRVPSIDIAEVGAGGGSIISADAAGVMHVGPESAGSSPGPACYGRGGQLPTLTDANVVLGYINPEAIAGGRVAIDRGLAGEALRQVGEAIDTEVVDVARGAYDIAVSNMTSAVKAVTSERGRDPREATIVAFGGAGPLYAASLARELGVRRVLVPRHTGLFSSLGLLVADTEYQAARSWGVSFSNAADIERAFIELEAVVRDRLPAEGANTDVERFFDMRYRGQRFELRIPVAGGPISARTLADSVRAFHAEHEKTYGRRGGDDLVEVVNLRVRGFVENAVAMASVLSSALDEPDAVRTRPCQFDRVYETPVMRRGHLSRTGTLGPLIIEDMDATTLVPPGATVALDELNNLVITWGEGQEPSA